MKLSDAIKAALPLGIPQGFDAYYKINEKGFCACGMGQGFIGAGLISRETAQFIAEEAQARGDDGWASEAVHDALSDVPWEDLKHNGRAITEIVTNMNDSEQLPLAVIADKLAALGY